MRAAQSIEKILGLCKRSEELLCPKRSTGTFGRINLFGSVKRGGGLVRLPSKCFRISHPLLRSFEIKVDFALCGGRRGAPPLDPATFEKVDETFTVEFNCATFFILLLFLQAEMLPDLESIHYNYRSAPHSRALTETPSPQSFAEIFL